MTEMDEAYSLTVDEVAAKLGVSRRQAHRYGEGDQPRIRTLMVDGRKLFHQADTEAFAEERRRIRAELSLIVEELGGKVEGFGRLEVSNASFFVNYDRKEIETVILKLIDHGHYHFADALKACKRESARPGALRVMRELRQV